MGRNPRLVVARITGWGQTGPYAGRAGFGTLAEAMSGFAAATGEADGPPTLPAFGLADSICGIAASSAILMALRHRDATGEGQVCDLSILEPIMTAVGPAPTIYQTCPAPSSRATATVRAATRRATPTAPPTTSGSPSPPPAQSIAERVLRLVGHPEVIDEPWFASGHGRVQHVDEARCVRR